jgi:hypothetical protein
MAKRMLQTWRDWPTVCREFAKVDDDITRASMKRAFKLAYIENYKHRDRIEREMGPAVVMPGELPPEAEKGVEPYTLYNYEVDRNQKITLTEKPTITPPRVEREPMPENLLRQIEEFMKNFGTIGQASDQKYRKTKNPNGDLPRRRGHIHLPDRLAFGMLTASLPQRPHSC